MKLAEEIVDIVDENDNVVRQATWKEMFENSLLHRTANVIVFNSKGEIFVHRRALDLKLYPGLYDVKFGGSVRAGETYDEAARRELFEEAGIDDVKLSPLFKCRNNRKENNVFRMVFKTVHDGKIEFDSSEVAEGRFMDASEISIMLEEGKFSPSAVFILDKVHGGKE